MFKISPINDALLQSIYASQCDTAIRDGYFAYAMIDVETNELMGFSQFEIESSCGFISDIKPKGGLSDFEAMFILGRATMNFIDMCGTHILTATQDAADINLLRAIGLKPLDDGSYFCDMTGFFDGSHCSGHNK